MDIQSKIRVARIHSTAGEQSIFVKTDLGLFKTREAAEAEAKKLADAVDQDAVVVEEGDQFRVYGVDELHPKMPAGSGAQLVREAPIVAFVASDPLTGEEKMLGGPSIPPTARSQPKLDIDGYAAKFGRQLDKVLGEEKNAFLDELRQLEQTLESQGINIRIELDDDVFEYRDKLLGFKHFLTYARDHIEILQQRGIQEVSIVDEWDNWGGVTVDLEYDKEKKIRRLELGDDFLDDWGESLRGEDPDSLEKLADELGGTLSTHEQVRKVEIEGEFQGAFRSVFQELNQLQQETAPENEGALKTRLKELDTRLAKLEKEQVPQAKDFYEDLSISQESKASLDRLKVIEDSIKQARKELQALFAENQAYEQLVMRSRMEKAKLLMLRGSKAVPDERNYIGAYVSGIEDGIPSTGLNYAHSFGRDRATVASIKAGYTPVSVNGENKSDVLLGLGLGHTFHTSNQLTNGLYAGVGVGIGFETPLFIGASVSNSWYLNDFHGLPDQGSVVGGAYATVGTLNNLGGYVDIHKRVGENIDFEGTGELSLFNQSLEAEAEFKPKNSELYFTGGVGTNKLLYAGIGWADKYELEIGLGGASIGKDSNNLPGETSWEIGLRWFPVPLPFFRHHRVPGYQMTYQDESKEYITPNGAFMTERPNAQGEKERVSFIPDPAVATGENEIAYRLVRSQEDLRDLANQPLRRVKIEPLGYLTVTEGDRTLVRDGQILEPLSDAELGIMTDQAGVLWFDKRQKSQQPSINLRREDMPLPLYRPVQLNRN